MSSKSWILVISVLLVIVVVWGGFRYVSKQRDEKRRKAHYEQVLKQVSSTLPSGASRKDVVNYLTSKDLTFRNWCCLGGKDASDLLVKLGQEKPPSHCSQRTVDLVFVFSAIEAHAVAEANDSDRLARTYIWDHAENCM